MHFIQTIRARIRQWIRTQARAVQIISNPRWIVIDPIAQRIGLASRVRSFDVDSDSHEVSPAFAHSSCFEDIETRDVSRAAGEAVGETVGIFVDYDTGVEGAVTMRGRVVPDEHPHSGLGPVCWGCKICVVGSSSILSVQDHSVVALSAFAIVICFEISCGFGEAEVVEEVMVKVCRVPELSY